MDKAHEVVYRRLAEHLDTLPDGYPPSSTDADLRVLARLFTPAEAAWLIWTWKRAEGRDHC